jgi:tyrosinase
VAVTRRNIITDTASRDKFIRGVLLLKQEMQSPSALSTYDAMVVWHWRAMMTMTPATQGSRNAAHRGPVFLPWHRYFLIVLEQQIQRILNDAAFGLPYWPWNKDGDKPPAQQPNQTIWNSAWMGGSGFPVTSGPFANPQSDPAKFLVRVDSDSTGGLRRVNRPLRRQFRGAAPALPATQQVKSALSLGAYDESDWNVGSATTFRNVVEGWMPQPPGLHNLVHVWVGGDMLPGTSPNDPVFFLNHCNEDRIWAMWQAKFGSSKYSPTDAAPAALRGHRPSDKLFSVFPNPPMVKDMFNVASVYSYDSLVP